MGRKTPRRCVPRRRLDVDVHDSISDYEAPNDDDIINSLDDLFNRRYDYQIDSSLQLPPAANFFRESCSPWQDNDLMSMKSHLNDVKSRLSSVDIVTWQNHTQVCCNSVSFSCCP